MDMAPKESRGVIQAWSARGAEWLEHQQNRSVAVKPGKHLDWTSLNATTLPQAGVLHLSARADHGGGPKHIKSLLDEWPGQCRAAVACPRDEPYWSKFAGHSKTRGMFELPHRRFDLAAAWRLRRWVTEQGFTLLHAHGKGASLYARFATAGTSVPVVYTPHGIHTGQYGSITKRAYLGFERTTRRLLSGIIFVSQGERLEAERLNLWPDLPRWVVPNGVAVPHLDNVQASRAEIRGRLRLDDAQPFVLTATRFDYQKNMEAALAIARACPEITFGWLGEGPDREDLSCIAARQGVSNVCFLGAVDDPEPYFAAADIYLSSSRWEGMPLAVIEAMAHGVPVVASDVVGNRDLVEHEKSGLLYHCGEVSAAAAALQRLAGDAALRRALGSYARRLQRANHSVGAMARDTWAVYQRVWRECASQPE